MYTGTSLKKAVRAWQQGREVRALDRNMKDHEGNIPLVPLENLLGRYEFLVDVEAVVDPEFEAALQEKEPVQEDVPAQMDVPAMPEAQENEDREETSPPSKGRTQKL